MDAVSARSGYQGAKNFKGKGIAEINDPSKKGLMPPGFSKSVAKPTGAAAGYSGNFSKAVVDVKGSALGSGNNKDSSSMKDDFDSFLDEVAGPGIGGGSSGIESAQLSNNVQSAVIPPSRARIGGLFLPYLPQDDAVAAGLGSREGGIDASEAQEVVDHLNQQLAALLRCSPAEFWKKVAMDETLDTFIDSYLHFRRRWYDGKTFSNNSSQTAGIIVGDGDLSRRVFMLLYRMSSNQDPGAPASKSLSAKEHAALLKDWKLLDLPKLLDICAVYDHDNHDLSSHLVSNVFRAQPSFADDLAAMVRPLCGKIDIMHQRCCTIINSSQETEEAVKKQLTEVVEYLNDVIITLDAFVGAYPPAASILVCAGGARNSIGVFLPALGAIHDSMLPTLSTGFTALGNPLPSSVVKEDTEVAAQLQLKQLKSRIVNFTWSILQLCFLAKEGNEAAPIRDFPSLGASAGGIMALEDPALKGELLVQAAVAMTLGLGEKDADETLVSLNANQISSRGALLQRVEKRHGLCEAVHDVCQSGYVNMDDAQYEYFLSLVTRGHALKVANSSQPSSTENKSNDEEAIMLQSKISQVKDLFPDYGDGFVALCLEAYDNDPEKVISCILEDRLHPDLASLDVTMATKPSKETEAPRDKGKGKVTEEPRVVDKGKRPASFDPGYVSARPPPSHSLGARSSESGGSSSGRQPTTSSTAAADDVRMQTPASNQGRFMRRSKEGGTFNELMNMKEKDSAFSATVRAGKQYEYEDEYDDSFDDLSGSYLADVEEETENIIDRAKVQAGPGSSKDEGPHSRPHPQRHGVPFGPGEGPVRKQPNPPRESSTGGLLPGSSHSELHNTPRAVSRGGHSFIRGGGHQLTGQTAQRWKEHESHKSAPVISETTNHARVGLPPTHQAATGENVSSTSGAPADGGRVSAPQGSGGATRGGKSRRGKGKVEATANFYLKDGKLYSYKVAGAEASFATVEEYEASQIQEEETIFGLGAGGNVPAANVEERDSSGNVAQAPGGRGMGGRGGRGGPAGRGRYPSKSYDNHRRKDQSMKKHFAGLGGL